MKICVKDVIFAYLCVIRMYMQYLLKLTKKEYGKEFDLVFENPVLEVIPTAHGKTVNIHNENR